MRQFFKFVLATLVGLLLFSVIGFFFLFIILAAAGSSSEDKVVVKENSVLKINLNQNITERSKSNPFENLPNFSGETSSLGVLEIRDALKNAAEDNKIKGVYIELGMSNTGLASIEEIRNALIEFKKSKKFVITYSKVLSERDYYLASVADRIFLNPSGGMEFNGYAANYTFFKGTLEKLEVKPEIFRVGEFKSAVEPFFLDKMSDASKLQTLSFLGSIQNYNYEKIAEARNIPVATLKTVADSLLAEFPEDALKNKLITDLGYEDEVMTVLREKLDIKKEKDKISFIGVGKYLKAEKKIKESTSSDRVAVILASGDIGGEKTQENETIGDDLAQEVRKARLDERVKAVVIRINSGGGSAFTSDLIWREIELTKKVKPVVASMSDVAASGGYYLAMACDTIVAHPNTITGSIGVFGLMFNVEPMLKNKLGVTIDGVETNPHASMGSRPLDDFERKIMQRSVEKIYDEFTGKVAKGRKTTQEEIKKIASGRVWSGAEAKEKGLVDVFGGLDDAIKIAGNLAKLKGSEYKVRYYPEKKEFSITNLINEFSGQEEEKIAERQLGSLAPYVKKVKELEKLKGVQMRMPFEVEIK
jgi:protease-4